MSIGFVPPISGGNRDRSHNRQPMKVKGTILHTFEGDGEREYRFPRPIQDEDHATEADLAGGNFSFAPE